MSYYVTHQAIRLALADSPELALPGDDATLERLVVAAELAVDARLGPLAVSTLTGRKLDLTELEPVQIDALRRAVAVAVGGLALADAESRFGAGDYVPQMVTLARGVGLGARIDEALAGFSLISRSGCVLPTVDPSPYAVP